MSAISVKKKEELTQVQAIYSLLFKEFKHLQELCKMDAQDFQKGTHYGSLYLQKGDKKRFFRHKNNGSPILGIAHCDVVEDNSFCEISHHPIHGRGCFAPKADDRIGVWVITHILPLLGINVNFMLTTDEEKGQSTASLFDQDQLGVDYNWMFMFDRRGEDVVFYGYEDEPWKKLWKDSGFTPATGSTSCISKMEDVGIKAANIGCGYHGEHRVECYVSFLELAWQLHRFMNFYHLHCNTKFPHEKKKYEAFNRSYHRNWDNGWQSGKIWNKDEGRWVWPNEGKGKILVFTDAGFECPNKGCKKEVSWDSLYMSTCPYCGEFISLEEGYN